MRPAYSGLRAAVANPVICGRKICGRCGRWRPVSDFRRRGRSASAGLGSYCNACERQRRRGWWTTATPAQRELVNEYHRFWREAKRAEAGKAPVPKRGPNAVDHVERVFLDPAPLVALLARYSEGEFRALARTSGVSERTLFRLRYGESSHVRLDHADRLALAMGSQLYWLYGDTPLVRVRPGRSW